MLERDSPLLRAALGVLVLSTACSEPVATKARPVSADTILDRSRRVQDLQSQPLDPRCCAATPESESTLVSATPVDDQERSDQFEILFDSGSAEVGRNAERAIHALADYLISHPEIRKVELGGYADIHGTIDSNERLGTRRAEAVKRILVRHSVAPDRLVTKSYGATELVASSTTAKGMRRNRRVMIRVIEPASMQSANEP